MQASKPGKPVWQGHYTWGKTRKTFVRENKRQEQVLLARTGNRPKTEGAS